MNALAASLGRRWAALLGRSRGSGWGALLIPPALPGSLGDAAMISAAVHALRDRGNTRIGLVCGQAWDLEAALDLRIPGERFFYGRAPLQQARLVATLPTFASCWFVGADVLDGAYNPRSVANRLSLLAEAARLGRPATVLGASYNTHPEGTTRQALRALPDTVVICARDPLSKARMEEALQRPIRLVADLAFLLAPQPDHPATLAALAWITERRRSGDRVLGLNANYLHAERDPDLPTGLAKLLARLLEKHLSILLVPHDTRSPRPDAALLTAAAQRLPPALQARVHLLPPVGPGVVRGVMPALDLLVTGRMHAAILAMSGGTPSFSFAYQDKFEGLLQLFGLEGEGLVATPSALSSRPVQVADHILEALEVAPRLRQRILGHLPRVMDLAQANFL